MKAKITYKCEDLILILPESLETIVFKSEKGLKTAINNNISKNHGNMERIFGKGNTVNVSVRCSPEKPVISSFNLNI